MENINKYFKYEDGRNVSGLTQELSVLYMLNYYNKFEKDVLIVTSSLFEATKLFNIFSNYTENVLLYPMDDFLTSATIAESPDLKFTRLETVKSLKKSKNIVITNLMGYLKFLPKKSEVLELNLSINLEIKRSSLIENLEKFGYNRESFVTSTGEYAVRGLVIDVFPIHESRPLRIEFDGDEIESIKYFDEGTQITVEEVTDLSINPVNEVKSEVNDSILDYMDDKVVFYVDYNQIKGSYIKLVEDIFSFNQSKGTNEKFMFEFDEIKPKFTMNINNIEVSKNDIIFSSKVLDNYNEDFDKLKIDFYGWSNKDYEVYFCLTNEKQISKIRDICVGAKFIKQKVTHGFIFEDVVYIGESDISKVSKDVTRYKSSYKFGKKIKSYDQLEIGDYVVHISHGIGVYNGIVKLNKGGIEKDFLQILYAGKDKIYVPASKITTIYKYGDKDGSAPKINKLGGDTWKKTKRYIEAKIKDISLELMKLYKERLAVKTPVYKGYAEDDVFDTGFEYDLTTNQAKSVNEILGDLQKEYPMDRLLCGDVGFGKTEVAFRGMFNTVLNNYQVMYLCPTTILSSQQYKVALERFKDWPIEIGLLNRFVSAKEAKITLERFNQGKIDILFGTHRILSDDVKPSKLGLLVVDEEQRFGVTHKEKIKSLKNDVNVLTLSATPIPRTLKMALSGLRDLSVIDTPPVNRYPVQTYVVSENEFVIKDAIYKELSRNGQVFILYNKVSDIESVASYIKKIVPDARVNFAHGQMKKEELENIMTDFVNYEYDILICTTIIESGIDIPNVNTLLVYDADHFGLSQLYQIRGRVGRSNKIGYAYLLYKEGKVLNEVATKRLSAIKEFTELGSGYKIAMRDLAIRGAGDVFGSSQAGFVDSVGISLYLKMIDDELRRSKGEEVIDEEEDAPTLLDVATHITDDYAPDEEVKLEIHQIINKVSSLETFNEVKEELENRFGTLPNDLIIYMYEEWFEKLASKLCIKHVKKTDRMVELIIPKEVCDNIKGDKLLMSAFQISTNFNIKYLSSQLHVSLIIKKEVEHYVILLTKLLTEIENNVKNT